MKRSNYKIIYENDKTVILEDIGPWDKYLTITNDAENVINDLTDIQKQKQIIYSDSANDVAMLIVKDNKFDRFGTIYNSIESYFN